MQLQNDLTNICAHDSLGMDTMLMAPAEGVFAPDWTTAAKDASIEKSSSDLSNEFEVLLLEDDDIGNFENELTKALHVTDEERH